jgi:hypothetical protein
MRIKVSAVLGGHGGADPVIVNEFLDYVRGRIQPSISPIDAKAAVAAASAATQSLRNQSQPVDICR